MIYRSDKDLLCDITGDQGDSSMRAGVAVITGFSDEPLYMYEKSFKTGLLRRSPVQEPWINEKNFSRDQMLPLIAGMSKQGLYQTIQRFFWKRTKNFFFMQNTERDKPDSIKLPYPHKHYKDSIPFAISVPEWKELKEKEGAIVQHKKFDYADVLAPQHIWHIIKASRMYPLYIFGLIGVPFFLIELFFHAINKNKSEENQMFAMAYVQGKWALKLYKRFVFDAVVSKRYWESKNEIEYHDATVKALENL